MERREKRLSLSVSLCKFSAVQCSFFWVTLQQEVGITFGQKHHHTGGSGIWSVLPPPLRIISRPSGGIVAFGEAQQLCGKSTWPSWRTALALHPAHPGSSHCPIIKPSYFWCNKLGHLEPDFRVSGLIFSTSCDELDSCSERRCSGPAVKLPLRLFYPKKQSC